MAIVPFEHLLQREGLLELIEGNTGDLDLVESPSDTVGTTAVTGSVATVSAVGAPTLSTGSTFTVAAVATRTFVQSGSYLSLTGAASSLASTPDHNDLDITADIDIQIIDVACDLSPAATMTLVAKSGGVGNRGWQVALRAAGNIRLTWSTTGSDGLNETADATLASVGAVDNELFSVRVTLDADDGAGNRAVRFYHSFDHGASWTQTGTTQTTAGTTSLFPNTSPVYVGAGNSGTSDPFTGTIGRVIVKNGIGGTIVADANFSAQTAGTTTFTDSAGRPWTVDSAASIVGLVKAGATPTPSTVATRSFIQSGSYLSLPGSTTTSTAVVPDTSDIRYTATDMEGEMWLTVVDGFTHASALQMLASKINTLSVNTGGWYFALVNTGVLRLVWGEGASNQSVSSTATLQSVAEVGKKFGLKWTLDKDNGSSLYEVKFYYDLLAGAGWQQLGATITGGAVATIASYTGAMNLGSDLFGNNNPHNIQLHSMIMRDGIGGSTILSTDWTKQPSGTGTFIDDTGRSITRGSATSIVGLVNTGSTVTPAAVATVSTVGAPVTQTSSTVTPAAVATVSAVGVMAFTSAATPTPASITTRAHVQSGSRLDTSGGGNATSPDHNDLDITSDIEIQVIDVYSTNWNASQNIVSKLEDPSNRSYALFTFFGALLFAWTTDGTTGTQLTANTPALSTLVQNGHTVSFKVTLDVDDGAGNRVVTFYYSFDHGSTWTQWGSPTTTAGTTSIFSGNSIMRVGSVTGRIGHAIVKNGIGGTVVADPDFSAQPYGTASFTDSTGKVWTVNSPASIVGLVSAGSTHVSTAVATVSSVGAPTLSTGSTVTTTAVATASTVGTMVFTSATTPAPAAVTTRTQIQSGSYLYLPGSSTSSTAVVPDESGLRYTATDMEGEMYLSIMDGYTHGSLTHILASKINTLSVNTGGWYLVITTTGALQLLWGTGSSNQSATSTATLQSVLSVGQPFKLKWTLDKDNGSGFYEVKYYIDVGDGYVQLGSTVTGGTTATIASYNGALNLGSDLFGNNNPHQVRMGWFVMRDAIGGSDIVNVDWRDKASGTGTFTASTGESITRGSATSLVGLVNTGVTLTQSAVVTNSTVGTPVISAGSTLTPAAVATIAAVGAPTVRTGSTHTSTAVATVSTVGSPVVQTSSTVTPTAVVTVTTVGVPTESTGTTKTVTAVATVSTVGAPTVVAITYAAPSTVATATTVGVPTISAGSTVTTTTVVTVSAVGAPAVKVDVQFTSTSVATTTSVGAPVTQTGATPTPTTVATVSTVGAPTVFSNVWDWEDLTLEGWGGIDMTLVNTSDQAHGGTRSLKVTSEVTAFTIAVVAPMVQVSPGETYALDLWGYRTGDAFFISIMTYYKADGVTQCTGGPSQVLSANWGSIGSWTAAKPCVLTAPSDAAYVLPGVLVFNVDSGEIVYFDDAQVKPATVAAPSAVPTISAVGAPALSAGSTVTTTAVATVSAVGAPVTQTSSAATPAVVATITAIGVPVTQGVVTIAPATVATVSAVGTIDFTAVATPAPAAVTTTTAVGAPSLATGATPTPSAVATISAVGAPAIATEGNITAQPNTVATASAVGVPTASTGSVVTASVVATASAVGSPTIQTGATPLPASVATSSDVGVPAVQAEGNSSVVATTVPTATSIGTPVTQTYTVVSPAEIVTVTQIGSPVISAPAAVPLSLIETISTVGVVVVSATAAAVVTTVGTSTQVFPVSPLTGASVLAEAIQTQTQIGFAVVEAGFIVAIPVVITVDLTSRTVDISVQDRSMSTDVDERIPQTAAQERPTLTTVTERTISGTVSDSLVT